MMFEDDRSQIPRSYVGLDSDNDAVLRDAIQWCLRHADGNPRRIGIQVGSARDVEDVPLLDRLARAGAQVCADSSRRIGTLPSGPVLFYHPLLSHLCQSENKGIPSAILAFGITGPQHHEAHFGGIGAQPWVTAFDPEHLGGTSIAPKRPIIEDPVVSRAMDSFTSMINSSTGLSDSRDKSTVVEGLTKLRASGHSFDPSDLLAGALARNWRGDAAQELQTIARQINDGIKKRYQSRLRTDIVAHWRQEAEAHAER